LLFIFAVNARPANASPKYRGRIAPSPTGYLHLGHARTFWIAQERARARDGELILRNEDLDSMRYKMDFVDAMLEDLRWFGFQWSEGPDIGGTFAPYNQSERMNFYRAALEKLRAGNFIYPCTCSRKDIQAATRAPHANDDGEPIYPGTCRKKSGEWQVASDRQTENSPLVTRHSSLRFRVPDGETISFSDGNCGEQKFVAGKDFGDFVVWRHDDIPAYQLACVADDAAMEISEVVRGADLLVSTARQILIYRALGFSPPKFFHCALMLDEKGERLAKRHDALSLRTLRARGISPAELRSGWRAAG
jgi:glutamyl-tRNA synthetase